MAKKPTKKHDMTQRFAVAVNTREHGIIVADNPKAVQDGWARYLFTREDAEEVCEDTRGAGMESATIYELVPLAGGRKKP